MDDEDDTASGGSGNDQGGQQPGFPNTPEDKNKEPKKPADPDTMTKAQALELVEKARKEEKTKLYSDLQKLKEEQAAAKKTMSELQQQLQDREKEVEDLRVGKKTEVESINEELKRLKTKESELTAMIEAVASEAAQRVRLSELAAYRTRAIAEAGIKELADLVSGDSEEAIAASVKTVKEREKAIEDRAREQVRSAMADQLPTPLSPGSSGFGGHGILHPTDKEKIARLPDAEYNKTRAEILKRAKEKAGLT